MRLWEWIKAKLRKPEPEPPPETTPAQKRPTKPSGPKRRN